MEVRNTKCEGRTFGLTGVLGAIVSLGGAAGALASVPAYVLQGSYALPTATTAFDTDASGRVIGVTSTGAIMRQQSVNGSTYDLGATLPAGTVQSFGPGLVRVSTNGATLAIGDNGAANHVFTVPVSGLSGGGSITPSTLSSPNFEGNWADSTTMYVSGFGTGSSVYRLNTSGGAGVEVVSGVGDGSGGVAVGGGFVYVAIGFDAGFVRGGEIRSFSLAALGSAASSVAFSAGTLIGQANSGNTLDFDDAGNLIEAGFGGVSVFDLVGHTRYDLPGLDAANGFYTASFNDVTHEILVRDFGSSTVLRYGVPAPSAACSLAIASVIAARRRRHA